MTVVLPWPKALSHSYMVITTVVPSCSTAWWVPRSTNDAKRYHGKPFQLSPYEVHEALTKSADGFPLLSTAAVPTDSNGPYAPARI